jgi:FAD/FMN-containing dehydrogenase
MALRSTTWDEGADGLRAAYGAKLARLAALKAKFDPTNSFRMNQNVTPAPVVGADAAVG